MGYATLSPRLIQGQYQSDRYQLNWYHNNSFYVTAPDWVSRREQREYIHQVIMTQVKFCDHIDGDGKTKEMSDSIYEISKKTGDYMIDWYKRNHKSE